MNNFLTVLKLGESTAAFFSKLGDFFSTPEQLATFVSSLQRFGLQEKAIGRCSEASIKSCILALAETRLSLLHKECYLVPRGNVLTFVISYLGLCALAYSTNLCDLIVAHPVYKGESFEVIDGTETRIVHRPDLTVDRSDQCLVGIWAKIELANGKTMAGCMSKQEIDSHRTNNQCGPAWKNSYVEMAKKTVLRRLFKTAPKALSTVGITENTTESMPSPVYEHEQNSSNPLGLE